MQILQDAQNVNTTRKEITMTKNIKTPVQLAQGTIIELFEENKNLLIDLTLMSNPIQ